MIGVVVFGTDPDHTSATAWLAENSCPLLTTDYVIDETLTLLRARGERTRALLLGARFFRDGLAEIHKITEPDLELAWETFERFADKDWSLTDCTSQDVIEQLGITHFAFDQHCKQFSTVQIVTMNRAGLARNEWRALLISETLLNLQRH